MTNLYVPIIEQKTLNESHHGKLYHVTCKKQHELYKDKGSSFNGFNDSSVSFLNNNLKKFFNLDTFSFKITEYNNSQNCFRNFSERVSSISLGLFCSAYAKLKDRKFKERYNSITITGKFDVLGRKISLIDVGDIDKKYEILKEYAKKHEEERHLFLYVSSEEIIPDGIQDNNIFVIRYDSNFPIECIFAEIFEDARKDSSVFQKNKNEFVETKSFIKLKKDFVKDKSSNGYIIKGESNTGKSIAAEALCKYLLSSSIINDYVWFYIDDNVKFMELLRKEKELHKKIHLENQREELNLVKEAYPKVFDRFDRLLQESIECVLIIDNVEYDIVDELLYFFKQNYPNINQKYKLIITSWEGGKINTIADSLKLKSIAISDISLDFNELKAIVNSIIKIKDYRYMYYNSSEKSKNELLEMLFQLCKACPGYIPLVLSALHTTSIEKIIEQYSEKDIKELSTTERILKITFSQIDLLSRLVLFAYLQIKDFKSTIRVNEIIEILKKRIFNNNILIDKNDIKRSIKILQ